MWTIFLILLVSNNNLALGKDDIYSCLCFFLQMADHHNAPRAPGRWTLEQVGHKKQCHKITVVEKIVNCYLNYQYYILIDSAGHATELPRQRDHVFRPQSCLSSQYYVIYCGYCIQTPITLVPELYYVVALPLSRSYNIVAWPALLID